MNRTLVDGQAADSVNVADRGLNYGDGVFRTLRVLAGRPLCWTRHVERLTADGARLGITCPDASSLRRQVAEVAGEGSWAVKIIVTRGSGRRGYAVDSAAAPRAIVSASPLPAYPAEYRVQGVRVHLCDWRLPHQPALAGIKHLNRLDNVMARREWTDPGTAEGLLRDEDGLVIEGVMSNVFAVNGAELLTPDLERCGVAGVQRQRVLERAPGLGLVPRVTGLTLDHLLACDEVFLTNSLIGLWPIAELAGRAWAPGPVGRRMAALLDEDEG